MSADESAEGGDIRNIYKAEVPRCDRDPGARARSMLRQ